MPERLREGEGVEQRPKEWIDMSFSTKIFGNEGGVSSFTYPEKSAISSQMKIYKHRTEFFMVISPQVNAQKFYNPLKPNFMTLFNR